MATTNMTTQHAYTPRCPSCRSILEVPGDLRGKKIAKGLCPQGRIWVDFEQEVDENGNALEYLFNAAMTDVIPDYKFNIKPANHE